MSTQWLCDPDKKGRQTITNKDEMQDSKMRSVRAGGESGNRVEGGSRFLDTRAFLFHHAHTTDGYRRSQSCPVCSKGVSGFSFEIEEGSRDNSEVHEGSGTDETGDATPTPGSRWDALWKGYQVSGQQE